jgi:hypothetical protein
LALSSQNFEPQKGAKIANKDSNVMVMAIRIPLFDEFVPYAPFCG